MKHRAHGLSILTCVYVFLSFVHEAVLMWPLGVENACEVTRWNETSETFDIELPPLLPSPQFTGFKKKRKFLLYSGVVVVVVVDIVVVDVRSA